jgi:hypothetical protein
MKFAQLSTTSLLVKLVGEFEHGDFAEAVAQIRADARIATDGDTPELIVIAQSRPGAISDRVVQSLRRSAPLAGLVGLLGSWCEGEMRTGRPWPDVSRVFWYQFPAWWFLQAKLRAAGLCPDWARPGNFGCRISDCRLQNIELWNRRKASLGVVALRTHRRETAEALASVFRRAGYSTLWHKSPAAEINTHGLLAGVWDGGQLDEREGDDLSRFCRGLVRDAAPVVAVLDYPRRDSYDRALECGAAMVLGKPWRNDELIASIEMSIGQYTLKHAA